MLTFRIALLAAALVQQPPAQETAASPLTVTLSTDKAAYVIGEEIQAEVTLANGGDKDLEVAALEFDERSLSFEITIDAGAGKKKTFRHAVVRPDPQLADRLAPPRVTLRARKSVTGLFRVPTLRTGDMTLSARYRGAEKEAASAVVTVKVAAQADGSSRLAAIFETSQGTIRVDLMPEEAPNNVANFVTLARREFYGNMVFHRVIKNSWIQTGCPYGLGTGGPGYGLRSEAKDQTALHDQGTVAMSGHMKSDYTGSQFFIALTRLPNLDRKFTVIGKTDAAGLEAARKIAGVDVDRSTDKPKDDVQLKKVSIVVVK